MGPGAFFVICSIRQIIIHSKKLQPIWRLAFFFLLPSRNPTTCLLSSPNQLSSSYLPLPLAPLLLAPLILYCWQRRVLACVNLEQVRLVMLNKDRISKSEFPDGKSGPKSAADGALMFLLFSDWWIRSEHISCFLLIHFVQIFNGIFRTLASVSRCFPFHERCRNRSCKCFRPPPRKVTSVSPSWKIALL